jgi:pantoate--beta-alanine ligase
MTETNAEISITAASFSGAVFFTSLFRRIPGSSLWAGSFGLCLTSSGETGFQESAFLLECAFFIEILSRCCRKAVGKFPGKDDKMIVYHKIKELKDFVHQCKKEGKTIGLVTTMGALHEGHASLIRAAHKENDVTITTVFVNPTQFGPNEDYAKYPRTLDHDCQVAEAAGADLLFAPSPEEMYPHKDPTWVEVTGPITKVLCGRTRPIHFRGVATVCTKFFNLTECDRAYYGLKDAQQTQVLERMVEDLFMNVKLRIMPIVREADGLAKSSRNVYLSPEEHKAALVLSRSLKHAKEAFEKGERSKEKLISQVTEEIKGEPMSDIDYVEMYGMPGLTDVSDTIHGKVLLAVAVKFGKTRLIDNVVLEAE